MKKKILFLVSSSSHIGPNNRKTGNFLTETGHPYVTFKQRGYHIDIFSIKGGEAPLDGWADKNNELNQIFLNGTGMMQMKVTRPISEVSNLDQYDAVFVPGGLAPMADMPENEKVHEIIRTMWESGKIVSAVCHGPLSLLNVKLSDGSWLIDGKNITSFSNAEEENYAKADGRLVTGQNPASALGVATRVVTLLEPLD
ncbi:MAG: type 1 glutamine amidotransferase domain-containing protein [Bacteroidetes bacterium]|nr:type 1 glutamine amidotransferase domain-containing protein [Bacteroidota bacterium]